MTRAACLAASIASAAGVVILFDLVWYQYSNVEAEGTINTLVQGHGHGRRIIDLVVDPYCAISSRCPDVHDLYMLLQQGIEHL